MESKTINSEWKLRKKVNQLSRTFAKKSTQQLGKTMEYEKQNTYDYTEPRFSCGLKTKENRIQKGIPRRDADR